MRRNMSVDFIAADQLAKRVDRKRRRLNEYLTEAQNVDASVLDTLTVPSEKIVEIDNLLGKYRN